MKLCDSLTTKKKTAHPFTKQTNIQRYNFEKNEKKTPKDMKMNTNKKYLTTGSEYNDIPYRGVEETLKHMKNHKAVRPKNIKSIKWMLVTEKITNWIENGGSNIN